MEDVGLFYGHLVYVVDIWSMLWPFGICCGHSVYVVTIWYMLWPFGICCGHLIYFMVIWYIFPCFGMMYQEKSGNLRLLSLLWHVFFVGERCKIDPVVKSEMLIKHFQQKINFSLFIFLPKEFCGIKLYSHFLRRRMNRSKLNQCVHICKEIHLYVFLFVCL
jgi:hypothetical protein